MRCRGRLILFLQQSSVEWCSSLWMHVVQDVDPSFQRTARPPPPALYHCCLYLQILFIALFGPIDFPGAC